MVLCLCMNVSESICECVWVSGTTPKCVLVHYGFHKILNEFGHFYHDETCQPPCEWGLVVIDSELVQ